MSYRLTTNKGQRIVNSLRILQRSVSGTKYALVRRQTTQNDVAEEISMMDLIERSLKTIEHLVRTKSR